MADYQMFQSPHFLRITALFSAPRERFASKVSNNNRPSPFKNRVVFQKTTGYCTLLHIIAPMNCTNCRYPLTLLPLERPLTPHWSAQVCPRRFGLNYDPPAIILEYLEDPHRGGDDFWTLTTLSYKISRCYNIVYINRFL